jgi:biopolymer transport protein TolQ
MTLEFTPLAVATTEGGASALDHALESGGVVLGVLILLMVLSLISWFIIGYKTFVIWGAQRGSRSFIQTFRNATRLAELFRDSDTIEDSPARNMFRAGYQELNLLLREREGGGGRPSGDGPAAAPSSPSEAFENIERALQRAQRNAISQLEYAVTFLATVGSAAPFIGLFGTVWGIMNAFANIDTSKPILETVTPHIAEALVATAIGLLAAIPAVMAYNWLLGRIRSLQVILEDFATDYLNIVRRQFFS